MSRKNNCFTLSSFSLFLCRICGQRLTYRRIIVQIKFPWSSDISKRDLEVSGALQIWGFLDHTVTSS